MKHYTIKKGNHYCSANIFQKIGGIGWNIRKFSLRFTMRSSCWWAPMRNNDDHDQNKLTGMVYGLNVHGNSVRLTWVPDFEAKGMIRISGYVYDKKTTDPKFTTKYITTVPVEQPVMATFENLGSEYEITVNGISIRMDNVHGDPKLCYRLYPYFGGNNTAPQDMVIDIEYL